ncbi:MAG: DUF5337 family protein [Defluviimonas sp.]|uniref:DUF5337 family protein n=1 Tax=Albidovulum sp. TaxID=1872424 RepID=UPI002A301A21|nr:DUF5337 family protein [Defluviimonas sp.]
MTKPARQDDGIGREGRLVALVIAGAMVVWIAGQWLIDRQGWDVSYALLLDLAALAAFFWALVVTWRIWQRHKRQGQ